jgi:hypothetical protein
MSKSTIPYTGYASLCALGAYLRRQWVFASLRAHRTILQKTVWYP